MAHEQAPASHELDPTYRPRVLMPEMHDPLVASIGQKYSGEELGVDLTVDEMPLEEAAKRLKDGEVDIVIAGVGHDTPTVLDVVLRHFRKPDTLVSSFFMMERPGQEPEFFADCAVIPYPEPSQLVKIAEHTCEAVQKLGYEPVVAFLELSTFGSAGRLLGVQQTREAAERFQSRNPDIKAYGELQADAATHRDIFIKKAKGRVELKEDKMPNVFIFPDGRSGNISYKLLEQRAGYTAIGPILTGLSHHFHDSSRGTSEQALLREVEIARDLYLADRQAELTRQSAA